MCRRLLKIEFFCLGKDRKKKKMKDNRVTRKGRGDSTEKASALIISTATIKVSSYLYGLIGDQNTLRTSRSNNMLSL